MSTGIEWCDETWNPLRGCTRVSQGCKNCYAEGVARRFSGTGKPFEGLTTRMGRWNGTVKLVPEALTHPMRWRRPRRIFVNSVSDLFHEAVPFKYIAAVFGVMAATPRHTFIVLTKRDPRPWFEWLEGEDGFLRFDDETPQPGLRLERRWAEGAEAAGVDWGWRWRIVPRDARWPLPNVVLGVSVEDQATADQRIPWLLETPAAVRAVSYEPALGFVDWEPVAPDLDWLILGGESGPSARPCNAGWFLEAVQACSRAGVACFVKQLGANPYTLEPADEFLRVQRMDLNHRKGGDPTEWPADLRVREFP